MSSLKSNVIANLAGQGWVALIQLLVVPVYLHLLGVEAYGLIGFYAALFATVQVFDLGLGQTMTRELARRSAKQADSTELHDLVGTIEKVYLGIAVAVCIIALLTTPIMAKWVTDAARLPHDTVMSAFMLMAILVALQLTGNFYQCGLVGLEKFKLVNLFRAVTATVTAIGGIVTLVFISSSIVALFVWQAFAYAAYVLSVKALLRVSLPRASRAPIFRFDLLKSLWRFAAGMGGIAVTAVIVTQIDKWILINLLSLENFGYYAVAGVVSTSLYFFIGPMFSVLFARFSSVVAEDNKVALTHVYRTGTQMMVIAVIPAAITLSLFSQEVVSLWTRNPLVSAQAAPIVSVLVIGTAVNGIMNVPFAFLLAHGGSRLVLGINFVAIAFLIPTIISLTLRHGPLGAAYAWLAFNIFFALIAIPLTHARFPAGDAMRWMRDVLFSAFAASVVLGLAKVSYPAGMSDFSVALYIVASYAVSVFLVALCCSQIRRWMLEEARLTFSKVSQR